MLNTIQPVHILPVIGIRQLDNQRRGTEEAQLTEVPAIPLSGRLTSIKTYGPRLGDYRRLAS
jgi:hypothetical protein